MTLHQKKSLLLPLLALAMTVALASTALAQGGSSASLQINFGGSQHWSSISGTHVREIRGAHRPDYDMFRYGNLYYVYRGDHWYSSRRSNGSFTMIEERNVPREFNRIPREHWRNYPSNWSNDRRDGHDNGRGPGGNDGPGGDHGHH